MLSCYMIRLEKVFVVTSEIKKVSGFKDSITSYSKTLALKKKKNSCLLHGLLLHVSVRSVPSSDLGWCTYVYFISFAVSVI